METTNENIRQLLEMLDHPEAYTEQEILDIINRDEDTRAAYRFMVEAKRSSRHRKAQKLVDVDAAWERFRAAASSKSLNFIFPDFRKIAASFIGILLVSSIAFATIRIVQHNQRQETTLAADTTAAAHSSFVTRHSSLPTDTAAVQPVIYDNIPLEKMLTEIAAHYDIKVTFLSDEIRELRFRFVWNPQQGIDQVISDLNKFERLTVTRKDNQITVE